MNTISIPYEQEHLISFMTDFVRRAIDGTITPIVVDYANGRVILGGSTISANPATVEVAGGDLKIAASASGVIFTAASGNTWRLTINEQTGDDGSTYAVPVLSRVS